VGGERGSSQAARGADGHRLRFDKVEKEVETAAHIRIGAAYKGWRMAMFIYGRQVEIVSLDGAPLTDWFSIPPGKTNHRPDQWVLLVDDVWTHRSPMSGDITERTYWTTVRTPTSLPRLLRGFWRGWSTSDLHCPLPAERPRFPMVALHISTSQASVFSIDQPLPSVR